MDVRLNSWAYVAPVLDRESILVIAELDRAAQVAVCGPDSPGPLRRHCTAPNRRLPYISTGGPWLVCGREPLRHAPGPQGGDEQASPPIAPGRWLHVLTDAEPGRFLLQEEGGCNSGKTLPHSSVRNWRG